MRQKQTSEVVPAKIPISQAVWWRVPKRRAGRREGLYTFCVILCHVLVIITCKLV